MGIQKLIEEKRKSLIELAKNRPLTDPQVVKSSQELDIYINLYLNGRKENKT